MRVFMFQSSALSHLHNSYSWFGGGCCFKWLRQSKSKFSGLLNLWSPNSGASKIKLHSKELQRLLFFSGQGSLFAHIHNRLQDSDPVMGPTSLHHWLFKRPPRANNLCCTVVISFMRNAFQTTFSFFQMFTICCYSHMFLQCGYNHLYHENKDFHLLKLGL